MAINTLVFILLGVGAGWLATSLRNQPCRGKHFYVTLGIAAAGAIVGGHVFAFVVKMIVWLVPYVAAFLGGFAILIGVSALRKT
jgi:uncharacterized membrane protein YeaQ/YmgE (transglycosylase-associated protein family)